ncbi:MAG: glycoside hydrolase family 95 protein [Clostridia bacterium]|nr:glycoside hydrolase family 95 protein [Clostridia bacterium]
MSTKQLLFHQPADERVWTQALPLGNGSLGAMVYGGISAEHFQINQESVWSKGFQNRVNPEGKTHLEKIRKLLFQGEAVEAEQEVYEHLLNPAVELGHYEPLCDLRICYDRRIPPVSERFHPIPIEYSHYSRTLDLETALYRCEFEQAGRHYQREALISYPDQTLAIQLTADAPMSLRLELGREGACESVTAEGNGLILKGRTAGVGFVAHAQVTCDGQVEGAGNYLFVENARRVQIYLAGRTDFYGENPATWCRERVRQALQKGYEALRQEHVEDYRGLFDRMNLTLEGNEEVQKAETFFHFGRYLLIASSRPGSLPANLQGLWNRDFKPPWNSGYTLNINLEMNYWLAEAANLSECHLPLMTHIHRMIPHGQDVAARLYGCRGAVAFHNTDIYGDCAPCESWMPASAWPMGLAWLATHIMEHYRYTEDLEFLREHYEDLREVALFFVDFLVETPDGTLVTCPSSSPENTYVLPNGQKGTICYGPAMDSQILREIWGGMVEASAALGKESDPLIRRIQERMPMLARDQIGGHGQLLEWPEEWGEEEPGHRHISHLFGLYPGKTISRARTPRLAEAARVTLRDRLAGGGGQTGWSRGWLINLWARLGNGQEAWNNLATLLREQTAENLFDLHPPLSPAMPTVFQIDGNFGGASGMLEMLVQSQEGSVQLLPALPKEWKSGSLRGVRARGNLTIDLSWQDGQVTAWEIRSPEVKRVKVEMNGEVQEWTVGPQGKMSKIINEE